MTPQTDLVRSAMDALYKDFDGERARQFFSEELIQHNPELPTGLEPVLAKLPALKAEGFEYQLHRIFEDGDLVVTHSTFQSGSADGRTESIAFEIWRIEGGKIAEHWDNVAPKVEQTASGRSQVDGVTEVADRDKTEDNRAILQGFINDVILKKAPEKITEYISSEQYDQHNPLIKDGLEGIFEALEYYDTSNVNIHKTLGEGNFMLILSEGQLNGDDYAYFDLFRIKDGMIVEHWDVIQAMPGEMPHENGKF